MKTLLNPERLISQIKILLHFLRSPIREIKNLPDWEWKELLLLQVLTTSATGALTGLFAKSFLGVLSGLLITPILTAVTLAVSSLFFYYVILILTEKALPFRKLYTLLFFANLPFFIFQILSHLIPPISLIGFGFTALILVTGLIENFTIEKKLVFRLVGAVYLAVFLMWVWGRWESFQIETKWKSNQQQFDAPEVHLGK